MATTIIICSVAGFVLGSVCTLILGFYLAKRTNFLPW